MTLLNINEVASLLRCSRSTIYRWMAETRKGNSTFPLPITGKRKRGLWHKEDIEAWSNCPQSNQPYADITCAQLRDLLGLFTKDNLDTK